MRRPRIFRTLLSAAAAPAAQVGGQAVIEGVMMRGVANWSVAVRRQDGRIALVDEPIRPWASRHPALRVPLVRGVIALGESLVIGMKALAVSAQQASIEEGDDGEEDPAIGKGQIALTLAFSLIFAVGLFFVLPVFLTNLLDLESGFAFWAVEGVIRVGILILYLWLISLMPDLKRVFQYHAAEHMTIHAHEAGEPLDAVSASRFSQLHVRCGTAFLLIVMVISVFVFAAVGTPALHWLILSRIVGVPVVAGISYEVIRWAGRHKDERYVRVVMTPGLWLQHLTTRRPDLTQLEVACEALKRVLALEERPPAWADKVEVMA
ncbi:MAG: DUF1385 domain-containing protein [Actinomycetota bacterium]